MLESFFKLKENHTNVKTEVVAGLTTFMTMAYILAVNPSILSASGMDANAILMATVEIKGRPCGKGYDARRACRSGRRFAPDYQRH